MRNAVTCAIVLLLASESLESDPTINLCCQTNHVHINKEKAEWGHRCDAGPVYERGCTPHSEETASLWTDLVWQEEQTLTKGSEHFKFKEPAQEFLCTGKGMQLVPVEFMVFTDDIRLQANGSILAVSGDDSWEFSNDQFCLAFSDLVTFDDYQDLYPDYENNATSSVETIVPLVQTTKAPSKTKLRAVYFVCQGEPVESVDDFTNIFYPIALFLSSFFILLTIVISCLLEDMRNNLYGKLKLGFLVNVFIAYLFSGVNYALEYSDPLGNSFKGTPGCVAIGYIIQHTWVAFFCWTTAMAINITRKFSNVMLTHHEDSCNKELIMHILMAQGLPTALTIVTIVRDVTGACDSTLPNIGHFGCFLGQAYDPDSRFVESSVFYYFYLIITILMIINMVCFIITGYNLTKHWRAVKDLQTNVPNTLLSHMQLVVNLFFIMGIPFVFDIISAAVEFDQAERNHAVRITLDILNLFTGIIIFFVICCKPRIIKKVRIHFATSRQESYETQKTQEESINLRKFSTVSGISSISTISNKTMQSEMVLSEEDEETLELEKRRKSK